MAMPAPPPPELNVTTTAASTVGPLYSGDKGAITVGSPALISKKDLPIYLGIGAATLILLALIARKK